MKRVLSDPNMLEKIEELVALQQKEKDDGKENQDFIKHVIESRFKILFFLSKDLIIILGSKNKFIIMGIISRLSKNRCFDNSKKFCSSFRIHFMRWR